MMKASKGVAAMLVAIGMPAAANAGTLHGGQATSLGWSAARAPDSAAMARVAASLTLARFEATREPELARVTPPDAAAWTWGEVRFAPAGQVGASISAGESRLPASAFTSWVEAGAAGSSPDFAHSGGLQLAQDKTPRWPLPGDLSSFAPRPVTTATSETQSNLTVIPLPSTASLGMLGLAIAGAHRRRRGIGPAAVR